MAAELAYYCRRNQNKLILFGSSDNDFEEIHCIELLRRNEYGSLGFLRKYSIENASLHIAQTKKQSEMLKNHFGKTSVIIKTPFSIGDKIRQTQKEYDVLWIGKSDNVKRPEIIVKLTSDLPQCKIMMVLNFQDHGIHHYCLEEASNLDNLTILEYVPFSEIDELFMKSRLLVNTSQFEGFPNTFLQAVNYRLPIISLKVNPDNFLSSYQCGFDCLDDYNIFKERVQEKLNKEIHFSEKCRNYVIENHDINHIVLKIDSLINDL